MKLELVRVQRGGRSKYAAPFDDHCGYTPEWWNRPMGEADRTQFIQVLRDGAEVARVELDKSSASITMHECLRLRSEHSKSSSSK
jgi:hypothetical protein